VLLLVCCCRYYYYYSEPTLHMPLVCYYSQLTNDASQVRRSGNT